MAIVTSPLLSLGASGTIGKSITFASWKGLNYARQRVDPANPKTVAQTRNRQRFKNVHDMFKYLPAEVTAPWYEYAKGKPQTGPNAWQQANMVALAGATTVNDIQFAKPVNGGPPTPAITVTPGSGSLAVAATAPTLPPGWTITEAVFVCMKQQDPTGENEIVTATALTDATAPYSVTFSSLAHSQAYVTGAFFKYAKPDGSIAYGGSMNHTDSTT